jgi:flagellar basal-body rod protein FlgB
MQGLALFEIGHERSRWLAARVAAIASNVANADTPGYRTRDVPSFEAALSGARIEMRRSEPMHLAPAMAASSSYGLIPREGAIAKHSGNTVSLETEMALLGEARGQQAAVTGIMGAFHRLLLASARG